MQRILLIEDDRSIRAIIALQLRILGYQVEVAEDGEKGIELFTRVGNFDLVITDIRMPRKDGNDVAKHIRSSERAETPIIAITAYKDEVQPDLFNFSIIKPFRNEDLIKAIRSLEYDYPGECVRVPEKIQQAEIELLSDPGKS
jgi:two-component system, OmpR family, response regulator CpxR